MVIARQQGYNLVAMGSPLTRLHMEVRGLGIINVKDLFERPPFVRKNCRFDC